MVRRMRISVLFTCLCALLLVAGVTPQPVQLTYENFHDKVMESEDVWMVEFMAPWCGHCQRLAPEWDKAARSLKGIVKFGVVNCDEEKTLASEWGIRGFPTIKIFGHGLKRAGEVEDYNGPRSAAAISRYAASKLPNLTTRLSQRTVEAFLKSDHPKFILFTAKSEAPPMVRSLSLKFKNVVEFGIVRDVDKEVAQKFGISTFPAIKMFKMEEKEVTTETGTVYDGPVDVEKLQTFIESFLDTQEESGNREKSYDTNTVYPDSVEDIWIPIVETSEDLEESCLQKPHKMCILTSLSKDGELRDSEREVLRELAFRYRKDPFTFVEVLSSSELRDRLYEQARSAASISSNLADPLIAVVKVKKGRFAFHAGALSLSENALFFDRVIGGDVNFTTIGPNWIEELTTGKKEEL